MLPLLVKYRDALHGWGQVVLSVNVSPVSKDYDETAHVLKASKLTGAAHQQPGNAQCSGWARWRQVSLLSLP